MTSNTFSIFSIIFCASLPFLDPNINLKSLRTHTSPLSIFCPISTSYSHVTGFCFVYGPTSGMLLIYLMTILAVFEGESLNSSNPPLLLCISKITFYLLRPTVENLETEEFACWWFLFDPLPALVFVLNGLEFYDEAKPLFLVLSPEFLLCLSVPLSGDI